jgi:protein-S-isoprenylcysteine O-methyltransferase
MEDRPMSLAWELGLIYLVSEILLTLTRRSRSKTGTKQDRSTLGIIWLVIALSIMAGVFVAQNFRAVALPHGRVLASASVVLFVAGLILRWWAIIMLGRFFTVDVTIEKDHELVERGPFRIVRHPSYTGVLLAFVGLGLSLRNWAALLVILLPIGAAFIRRMNVEMAQSFHGQRPAPLSRGARLAASFGTPNGFRRDDRYLPRSPGTGVA